MSSISDSEPWGLIFDVDGVIADTEPLAMDATREVFHRLNRADVSREDMLALIGSTATAYFDALCKLYAPGADRARLVLEHNKILLSKLRQSRDLVFPGVRSLFVRALVDDHCRVGIATGSGRARSQATITACSLPIDGLTAWVTGDDIKRPKPDPEIYLATASKLGMPPQRCLAIEDSVAGVRAAKTAGMTCIAVTNTFPEAALLDADAIVSDLTDLTPQSVGEYL